MELNYTQSSRRLRCYGYSEWPWVRDGSEISISPTRAGWGDLVVYQSMSVERAFLCHRVIWKTKRALLLKGDACLWPDGWIAHDRVDGVVWAVDGRSGFRSWGRLVATLSLPPTLLWWVVKACARRGGRFV